MLKNSHIDAYLLPIHTLKAKLSQIITQKYYLRKLSENVISENYPKIVSQILSPNIMSENFSQK